MNVIYKRDTTLAAYGPMPNQGLNNSAAISLPWCSYWGNGIRFQETNCRDGLTLAAIWPHEFLAAANHWKSGRYSGPYKLLHAAIRRINQIDYEVGCEERLLPLIFICWSL